MAMLSSTEHDTNMVAELAWVKKQQLFQFLSSRRQLFLLSGVELQGGLFSTAVATIGMLNTAAYGLTMDIFEPIAENTSGIVELTIA